MREETYGKALVANQVLKRVTRAIDKNFEIAVTEHFVFVCQEIRKRHGFFNFDAFARALR
jgi:hypothetical protein